MSATTSTRSVIILGLGVAGPLSALVLLQRTDVSVTIYELRSAPATIGGALNLAPNAVRLLHRLGFEVDRLGASIPTITQQNTKGKIVAVMTYGGPANSFASPYTGRRVMRKDLLREMLHSLEKYKENGRLKIIFSKKPVRLTETAKSATIYFKDGTNDTADIILGADGIHSWTRNYIETALYNIPPDKVSKAQYTGLASLYAIVEASDLPTYAVDKIREHPMIMTSSQSAGLVVACAASSPLNEISWFVSAAPKIPPSPDALALNPHEIRNDVIATYGSYPSPFPELIGATKSFAYYPVYRLHPGPNAWASPGGRIVLVGDAAHAIPPHAAQGVGMGIEDSIIIAKILKAVEASGDWSKIDASLWRKEYRDRRLPRCRKFNAVAESRGAARKPQSWILAKLREWITRISAPLLLFIASRRDTQGWGYDVDTEVIHIS